MSNLWWQTHRQLVRGSRGEDVEKAQKALNQILGLSPALDPDGIFGQKTHDAVVQFQEVFEIEPDGILGPVTQTMLLGGGYRVELAKPRHVPQGSSYMCWAASLDSLLGHGWAGRPRKTMDDLVSDYPDDATQTGPTKGEISVTAFKDKVGSDHRFREVMLAADHSIEQILRALRHRVPILMVTVDAPGGVFHARVLYGVKVSPSGSEVFLMDPMAGYTKRSLFSVNAQYRTGFFMPNEVSV